MSVVELRKAVDTRAGRVLIALALLLSLLVLGVLVARPDTSLTVANWLGATSLPVTSLVPVLGVLAMTSEWTQRTALTTFTLTPRRLRVLGAKLVAAVVLGLLVATVVAGLTAAALAVRGAATRAEVSWSSAGSTVGGTILLTVISLLLGAALGALVLHSAGALVAYYLAPSAASLAHGTILRDGGQYIDIAQSLTRMARFDWSGSVGPNLTSLALWIALPLTLGLWRSVHRDVS